MIAPGPAGANPPLAHPGLRATRRRCAVASGAVRFDIPLAAGDGLDGAVLATFTARGLAAGMLRLDGLLCDPLGFVVPARPRDAARLAWYGEPHRPNGPVRIEDGVMAVGRNETAGVTHGHASLRLPSGDGAVGHLLGGETRVAAPAVLAAWGFPHAGFERHDDSETNFRIFGAARAGIAPVPAAAIVATIRPDEDLHAACREIGAGHGVTGASTTILGGAFDALSYCVAPPDPEGKAVIAYSDPIDAGPSYLVFGNATLGESMEGAPLVHCHGTIRRADGRHQGGHILPKAAVVGPAPIPVLVTAFEGFRLRQTFDQETNIPLLQPYRE